MGSIALRRATREVHTTPHLNPGSTMAQVSGCARQYSELNSMVASSHVPRKVAAIFMLPNPARRNGGSIRAVTNRH